MKKGKKTEIFKYKWNNTNENNSRDNEIKEKLNKLRVRISKYTIFKLSESLLFT